MKDYLGDDEIQIDGKYCGNINVSIKREEALMMVRRL